MNIHPFKPYTDNIKSGPERQKEVSSPEEDHVGRKLGINDVIRTKLRPRPPLFISHHYIPNMRKSTCICKRYIQGVPKNGNRSSTVNYFKDTNFILVNYAL